MTSRQVLPGGRDHLRHAQSYAETVAAARAAIAGRWISTPAVHALAAARAAAVSVDVHSSCRPPALRCPGLKGRSLNENTKRLKPHSSIISRDIKKLKMPDSPESKVFSSGPPSPAILAPTIGTPPIRSHSNSSCHSAGTLNGSSHSPVSAGSNGRQTPSPALSNPIQQLPPACGAKQLSKLKRFLTTLQQFGSDISAEIGERVRSLVLALVNSHTTIEEFHSKLQETTNFPLKPFVIPFLKATLPLLQRELMHCARLARQSPQHYLAHNEHVLFDTSTHSPIECIDNGGGGTGGSALTAEVKSNGGNKRKTPDSGNNVDYDIHLASKRLHGLSPGSLRLSPPLPSAGSVGRDGLLTSSGSLRLEDISVARELRDRQKVERERAERERLFGFPFLRADVLDPVERIDDDWKHVETMLSCIVGMVDKTKRALAALQERSLRDREELSLYMHRHTEPGSVSGVDRDVKKRTEEIMAHTLRQTEDRVSEVKRRAEEAVNEVKRQAVIELQKAVCLAESNANELIAAERMKMERSLKDVRKQAQEEILAMVNAQEESSENCWNCGRKANETCSGCNLARYCGAFCQHKDWENHHIACGKSDIPTESKVAASVSGKTAGQKHRKPSSPKAGNGILQAVAGASETKVTDKATTK